MREGEGQEAEETQEQSGWMKRLTTVFRKEDKNDSNGLDFSDTSSGSSSVKARPNLTLTTNVNFSKVSHDRVPTAQRTFRNVRPCLKTCLRQHSISPGPAPSRTPPWLTNPVDVASKRPKPKVLGPPLSPRSKPRRNASVPLSVSAYGPPGLNNDLMMPSTLAAAMTTLVAVARKRGDPQTPFSLAMPSGVPSFNHTNLPHYARHDSLLPENAADPDIPLLHSASYVVRRRPRTSLLAPM